MTGERACVGGGEEMNWTVQELHAHSARSHVRRLHSIRPASALGRESRTHTHTGYTNSPRTLSFSSRLNSRPLRRTCSTS